MPRRINNEIYNLKKIIGNQKRNPVQMNNLNESDSEIIKTSYDYLVTSTDMISDEIHWGLYKDPELVGWMSIVASLSDLYVTGANPTGLLVASHWGKNQNLNYRKKVYRGIFSALKKHKTFLLGGDSSSGEETVICTTAIGSIKQKQTPLLRSGIKAGDHIYAIGKFGPGPALGLRVLSGQKNEEFPEFLFKPAVFPLKNTNLIRAAIDVSDGLASSLCILSEINNISFDIEISRELFNPASKKYCQSHNLPISSLFFAEHGDYQPLVAVSPQDLKKFLSAYPNAAHIAKATGANQAHRFKNKDGIWKNIQLDQIYNADKSNLASLRNIFENWVAVAKELHLP